MSLEKLNEEVHDREFKSADLGKSLPFTPETPVSDKALPHTPKTPETNWTESSFGISEEKIEPVIVNPKIARRRKIALILGGIALILLVSGVVFRSRVMLFSTDKVIVSETGPKDVESNELVTFKVMYENKNWMDLEDVTLIVNHPSSFRMEAGTNWEENEARAELSLGKIASGTKGTVELRGTFHAFQNQIGAFQVVLRFAPKGVSSRYDTSAQWTVAVGSSPVTLDVDAPLQVGNDQTIEYAITYKNDSGDGLDNMRLEVEYPDGFHFTESTPKPSEGERSWYVGNIASGDSGKIAIRGTISGAKNDVKKFFVRLGKPQGDGSFLSFAEGEKNTRIVASPLSIYQSVNGITEASANPNESLNYTITFKNDGDLGLRDLILTVDFDTTYLEMSRLELPLGAYSAAKKQMLFRGSDLAKLSRLEPGESGEVHFSIPVKKSFPAGQKNLSIETIARIDSPDVPTPIGANKVIASNTTRVKVISPVRLDLAGYYTDSSMSNTGPLPPQVGKETTYTFHAYLSSPTNDILGGRLSIAFPGNVRYIGTRSGDRETISFNDRTGELSWEVGTLGIGSANLREIIFQVGITPSANQEGKEASLLKGAIFTGKDGYANRDVRVEAREKTTSLFEDPTIGALNGAVQATDVPPTAN
ncbi:MAG: hypothetical protein ABI747_01055 [Candidatus Moraniibacteriota bacterium]